MFLQQPIPTSETVTSVAEGLRAWLQTWPQVLLRAALVLLVFWVIATIGRRAIAYAAPRVKADTGVVLLLSRLYYYGILVFGAVTALGTAGLDVRALVAGLGLTGFALGFALKDVLSNFVSGMMLLAYRPFHLGDLIEMGEFSGTIETIRIRDTLVRAADGRLIIIPNTKLITEVVVNHSDAVRSGRSAPPAASAAAAPPARPKRDAPREADEETFPTPAPPPAPAAPPLPAAADE